MKISYNIAWFQNYTERDVLSRELSREMYKAVDSLPLRQKQVIILLEYEGKSYKETASILGCNVNTVSPLRQEALKNLREKLKDYSDYT